MFHVEHPDGLRPYPTDQNAPMFHVEHQQAEPVTQQIPFKNPISLSLSDKN